MDSKSHIAPSLAEHNLYSKCDDDDDDDNRFYIDICIIFHTLMGSNLF